MHRFRSWTVIILFATLPSCWHRDEVRELRLREAQAFESEEQLDAVDKAMSFLPMLMRIERGPILRDFINQVNAWAIAQSDRSPWRRTSLLDSIPAPLLASDFGKRLEQLEFADLESEYLAQCKLMRDVGRWVLERPYRDPLFAPWLAQQSGRLADTEAVRLEQAMKLFDWTMRNVALEGSSKDIEALIRDPLPPLNDLAIGYRALPWQTMMFGRGDALQRSRVFTQLLFQVDIPAVMLALPDPAADATENDRLLWCVGVPIGEEIYLFETRFGMPLPMADQAAVATLREAKANAAVLRRAKLPGRFDYPVSADELRPLIAMLDVEPFAVGRSMKALEERLTGDYRMKLWIDAEQVIERLRSIDADLPVQLWRLPWYAQLYSRELRSRMGDLSPFSIKYMTEFGAYMNESIMHEARLAHFQGHFDSTIDIVAAPQKYMNIRIDEATLAKLGYDTDIQRQLQVVRRTNEPQEEYQYRIQQAQKFYRSAKLDSNAFLGMLQFDLGNVDSAIDWLDNRLLQVDGTERWRAHARYLLGRCCEEKGDLTEAIGWYKSEGVPQEAGNRIRIRLLEKQHATAMQSKDR